MLLVVLNQSVTSSEKVDLSKEGMVTVHTKYNGDAVRSLAADNQVTVLALQYKGVNLALLHLISLS